MHPEARDHDHSQGAQRFGEIRATAGAGKAGLECVCPRGGEAAGGGGCVSRMSVCLHDYSRLNPRAAQGGQEP